MRLNSSLTGIHKDTDIDTYRTTVKKQIKDWHTAITTRKNQEWLILHVVRPDARLPSGNFFQMKGSVLEKMKADFNVEKRDRFVCLNFLLALLTGASGVCK